MQSYAIVETGSKQYRVQPGSIIRVESLPAEVGSTVELSDVRLLSQDGDVILGTPSVPGAKVVTEVKGHGKGKKVVIFKYKAKTRYRKKTGHRQPYTELAIKEILVEKEAKDPRLSEE